MAKICYVPKNFQGKSLEIIEKANTIIEEFAARGFDLTLRQLYYQFVSRAWLENTQKSYSRLGTIINDGRLAGLVDWDAITDRTRNLKGLSTWESPQEIIDASAISFRIDKWEDQDYHVEVWIEKDALVGVIQRVCNSQQVDYFSCRGYTSQSEMHGAAMRLKNYERNGQDTIIIHLGDHDPSGIDMSRDIQERLNLFGSTAEVRRIALNMNQVRQYNPPPNPAKLTDTRARSYITEYGHESWELDALDPTTMANLIRDEILSIRDADKWKAKQTEQRKHRGILNKISSRWTEVVDWLEEEEEE